MSDIKVNRVEIDDIKIVEFGVMEDGVVVSPDFVLMFFGYNKQNQKKVSELIDKYRKKESACIIGCVDIAGDVIDHTDNAVYEAFFSLMKQFDLYLDSASIVDFENLIGFFTTIEFGIAHFDPCDFKSESGMKIHIFSEEGTSITELKNKISTTYKKLFSYREMKFPMAMVAMDSVPENMTVAMTLDEFSNLLGTFLDTICDNILWSLRPDKVSADVIKVFVIFCEG